MSKKKSLLILGIWIALLPYLGLPLSWKKFLILLSGAAVAAVAYSVRPKKETEEDSVAVEEATIVEEVRITQSDAMRESLEEEPTRKLKRSKRPKRAVAIKPSAILDDEPVEDPYLSALEEESDTEQAS